jgi:hypothetical protein
MQPVIVGTAHISEGPDRVLPAGPPHTYFGMAQSFLVGSQALGTEGPRTAVALAFLSAQTAECALKAFLSRSGDQGRLKDLTRKPLRHNLVALWSLACSEGLQAPATPPNWLVTLGRLHDEPYYLRYATGVHGLVTPAPEPMLSDLTALVDAIRGHLQVPA